MTNQNQNQNQTSQVTQNRKLKNKSTDKTVVSPYQSMILIASTQIATGLLSIPRLASATAHETAWLPVLISTLISLAAVFIITKLALRFPNQTFIEFIPTILFGSNKKRLYKILALIFILPYLAMWLGFVVISSRIFSELVRIAIFPHTPVLVVLITLMIAALCVVWFELEVIARFNETVFPIILIPLVIIIAVSLQNAELTNLLPLFHFNWKEVLKTSCFDIFYSFEGFSIIFVTMAYTRKDKKSKLYSANLSGAAITGLLYTSLVTVTVAVFGYEVLQVEMWPTYDLAKTATLPGAVIERLDPAFISIWVAAVFTTISNSYYFTCFSIVQLIDFKDKNKARRWLGLCAFPIIIYVTLISENIFTFNKWETITGIIGLFTEIIIPIILLLLAILTKRKGGTKNGKENLPTGKPEKA
ncbi:GerAB/ArcD/ProY family transporter [Scopulibacillus cellulosilyticus]|uniref:Endospore germination permease n=1 Tax=Scopulibacillus cellulosilyticus TaxID=2665665 RepID=A0ABW2PQU8_9BACL